VTRAIGADTIERWLASRRCRAERITEDTWRTTYRGQKGRLPLIIRLDPAGHLAVAVAPVLPSPESEAQAAVLYRRLLELNQTLLMAKYSIDDDLDVVLSAEYPTADLDESEFHDALDALAYYADEHLESLRALSR
jgi:hypothetical protein